jgi:predicted MFS family arabinose efflux permease
VGADHRACPALGAVALGTAGEALGMRLPTYCAAVLGLSLAIWAMTRMPRWAKHLEPG